MSYANFFMDAWAGDMYIDEIWEDPTTCIKVKL